MEFFDMTKKAAELFDPEMTIEKLLVKLNIEAYKHYMEQQDRDLMELYKAQDRLLGGMVLKNIMKRNHDALSSRGLKKPSLDLF